MRSPVTNELLAGWIKRDRYVLLVEVIGSVSLILGIAIWLEINLETRARLINEDGLIENLTALFFGLASLGFVIMLVRSTFIREGSTRWRYFFTVGWAVVLFFLMGEEISWGQRILGFETPEGLKEINFQDEFNLHNIRIASIGDWTLRWFALQFMTFVPGVFLPILAITKWVPPLVQKYYFPVMPLGFIPIFVGSWALQKIYSTLVYNPNDLMEIREFLLAAGLMCFALHGSWRPPDLFRLPPVSRHRRNN